MENQKVIKTANTLDKFIKVLSGFLKAGILVCDIFAVLVLVFGSRMFVPGTLTLDLDFVTLHLSQEFQAITQYMKFYVVIELLVVGIFCALGFYVLTLLRRLLAPMKEGRVFEESVSRNLRKIGWAVVIGGGVSEILGLLLQFFLIRAYPLAEVFSSKAIAQVEYSFDLELGFLAVAAVLFFLSYIFRYGESLQQLSDETL